MSKHDSAVPSAPAHREIPLYIPDMPTAGELLPWLEKIDESRWYTNFGPLNRLFEETVRRYFPPTPAVHVTTVANGTLGLELALAAFDLPPRSAVLIPAFTFVATATAVVRAGLTPVLADFDPASWSLTPEIARVALEQIPIRVVMPVTTFGFPQPVTAWDAFSAETGVPVIIDAAGAWDSQPIGETTAVVFSLHATKNLSTGEGGIVASADPGFIERVRNTSNFGFDAGEVRHIGTNAKLSEYHAAVGLAMLARWQRRKADKFKLLQAYRDRLDKLGNPPVYQHGMARIVPSLLAVRLPEQSDVAALAGRLSEQGVLTRQWYYPPLYRHPAFAALPHAGELAVTREIAGQILGLPFHMGIAPTDMDYICFWLDRLRS
ncbi:MAG: DegT/DnrJ/EryC1/StrS family aminotransferase [Gammaproteobacteria bacterium]|nr:DegT/DnrJ/EryC1/StrS family aminotransferase [Gammaproteobacteria bacterium]